MSPYRQDGDPAPTASPVELSPRAALGLTLLLWALRFCALPATLIARRAL